MNNIIEITESTINNENNFIKYIGKIKINEKHDLFLEHFPEMPVLPGAATVSTIIDSITSALLALRHCTYFCKKMERVAFLKTITPKLYDLTLEFKYTITNNDEIKVQSSIVDSNKSTYCRGIFIFIKESE